MKPTSKNRYPGSNRDLLHYLFVLVVALVFIAPLIWMVIFSLRTPGLQPPRGVEWFPKPIAWQNYHAIFDIIPLGRYILNSLFLSLTAVFLTLLSASLAGFGMALLNHRARRILVILSIGMLMVPLTALWLTRFLLFSWLGWIDSYLALLAPAFMGTSSFFVLLYYWAFRRISSENFDAARLEGAAPLAIWRQVGLPQVYPTTVVVAVLTFIVYWNDFINPLLYLRSQKLYTLSVGLQQLQQLDRTNWPLLLAASVIMVLPVILLFLIIQRRFLSELRAY